MRLHGIKTIKTMRILISLSILLSFAVFTNAQNMLNINNKNVWTTYAETNTYKVEYQIVDCHDQVNGISQQNVLLRYTNKTSTQLQLNWNLERYNANGCTTCDAQVEYSYQLVIPASGSISGTCDLSEGRDKKLFVKHLGRKMNNFSVLTRFELANLEAKKL